MHQIDDLGGQEADRRQLTEGGDERRGQEVGQRGQVFHELRHARLPQQRRAAGRHEQRPRLRPAAQAQHRAAVDEVERPVVVESDHRERHAERFPRMRFVRRQSDLDAEDLVRDAVAAERCRRRKRVVGPTGACAHFRRPEVERQAAAVDALQIVVRVVARIARTAVALIGLQHGGHGLGHQHGGARQVGRRRRAENLAEKRAGAAWPWRESWSGPAVTPSRGIAGPAGRRAGHDGVELIDAGVHRQSGERDASRRPDDHVLAGASQP